jgi:flavodoxin
MVGWVFHRLGIWNGVGFTLGQAGDDTLPTCPRLCDPQSLDSPALSVPSRTGNTRVIAGQIRRAYDADLFEIQPAAPYPEDYEAVVSQAQRERDAGYQPPLGATIPNIRSYDVIFLGFPIWGMTTPPVIRSFLSGHDLSGKTLIPFVTHGGYGRGESMTVVAEHAPRSRLLEGFTMQADQERETLSQVTRWLGGIPIRK